MQAGMRGVDCARPPGQEPSRGTCSLRGCPSRPGGARPRRSRPARTCWVPPSQPQPLPGPQQEPTGRSPCRLPRARSEGDSRAIRPRHRCFQGREPSTGFSHRSSVGLLAGILLPPHPTPPLATQWALTITCAQGRSLMKIASKSLPLRRSTQPCSPGLNHAVSGAAPEEQGQFWLSSLPFLSDQHGLMSTDLSVT